MTSTDEGNGGASASVGHAVVPADALPTREPHPFDADREHASSSHPVWAGVALVYPDGSLQAWQMKPPTRATLRADQRFHTFGGDLTTTQPPELEITVRGPATPWSPDSGAHLDAEVVLDGHAEPAGRDTSACSNGEHRWERWVSRSQCDCPQCDYTERYVECAGCPAVVRAEEAGFEEVWEAAPWP